MSDATHYRIVLEVQTDIPLEGAEQEREFAALIESVLEGSPFEIAAFGIGLDVGIERVMALQPELIP